ncbi:unnamed protein product [Linum trigynum]|uniref:Uncharacterized protein n=1 Tax=Linum trigynum TaxID=586398 RepID=A0AAV2EWK1_9ROSI
MDEFLYKKASLISLTHVSVRPAKEEDLEGEFGKEARSGCPNLLAFDRSMRGVARRTMRLLVPDWRKKKRKKPRSQRLYCTKKVKEWVQLVNLESNKVGLKRGRV